MSELDDNLIDVLVRLCQRSGNQQMLAMLRQMVEGRAKGIDFKFDLYNIEQIRDPVGFDPDGWSMDMDRMFLKFRVKLDKISYPRPITGSRVVYNLEDPMQDFDTEATAEEIVELPESRKELTDGTEHN